MEQAQFVLDSLVSVLTLEILSLLALGTFIGIIAGALPGLSPITAMAVLIPVTYVMRPEAGIALFIAIYVGTQFGNSIPSILLDLPGTPAAAITAFEGYPLEKLGKGGQALGVALSASVFAQFIGGLGVALLLVPFSEIAVRFLFPEIFAMGVVGLLAVASLSGGHLLKGVIAAALGVALTTIGTDPISGVPRFHFGNRFLQDGMDVVALTVGLLIVGALFHQAGADDRTGSGVEARHRTQGIVLRWQDFRDTLRVTWVGTIIGFIVGIVPGAGGSVGGLVAYQQSRPIARRPDLYGGKGSLEALAAADSAQNATTAGSVIPTLGLGIPGSPAMIMVIAVLILHGVAPGPGLAQSSPESLQATIGSLLLAPLFLFVIGYVSIKPSLYITAVPGAILRVAALALALTGIFALRWNMFDVYVALGAGLLSLLMRVYGYPVLPAALGVILGDIIETNLRRGLAMTLGDYVEFFTRTPVVIILGLGIAGLLGGYMLNRRQRRAEIVSPP